MAHHNFETSDLGKYLSREDKGTLGATGAFPNGSYAPRDEGEIRFAVAADPSKGVVLVDFGKPVHSLGMTAKQAEELAETLRKKAWECRGIV